MEARAKAIIGLILLLSGCQKTVNQTDAIALKRSFAIARTIQTPIPTPIATTKTTQPRNLKIKVGLDSPSDLKVTVGMNVKARQVISDRPSTKQQLINQRQTLSFQIQQLQQQQRYQLAARENELEPLKLEVQTASIQIQHQIAAKENELEPLKLEVQTAWINLKRVRKNRRYTKTTYQQLPAIASSELTQGTQLEQAYLSAKSRLKQAESNLKAAKATDDNQKGTQLEPAYLSAKSRLKQAESNLKTAKATDDNQLRSLRFQIAAIDKQILQTGVTRSPYSGKVKKIKFIGQNNGELLAEITISTDTPGATENLSPSKPNKTTTNLSPSNLPQQPNETDTQVISVHDGDTIRTQKYRIRLACIDAPELKQPLGYQSRDNLLKLISQSGDRVRLQIVDTDRYGRKVALIYANGKLINSQQVTDGMAYAYKKYLSNCPQSEQVVQAETTAKQKQQGVWGANYQTPWEFRNDNRRN
jgi:micrococcal nuclease